MTDERRLLVSFSGGETSGYMTRWILEHWADRYDKIAVVFANTGEERAETLEFIRDCDERMGFGTAWIEAVFDPRPGLGTRHRVVDFATADRKGEVFEAFIAKFGIPNAAFRRCSSAMKREAIESFARTSPDDASGGLGWPTGSYDLAIGIRADEIDRQSEQKERRRLVYPLIGAGVRRENVMRFWERQNFRLRLKSYEGNCKTCWKKADRKLFTILDENPEFFEWNRRMEELYGRTGPEFRKEQPADDDYRRVFWRKNRSTADLVRQFEELKASGRFRPALDDRVIVQPSFDFEPDLDVGGGCEETCEVFGSDDEADE